VKCRRVVIEVGDNAFALDLHPAVTVIAGLSQAERESLVGELFGALQGNRTGVHLELADDSGRRLALLRPKGGRHRVVDLDSGLEVTNEFVIAGGEVNLLARAGMTYAQALDQLRMTTSDLANLPPDDDRIRALGQLEQSKLWGAAENLARQAGRGPENRRSLSDSPLYDSVEDAHHRLDAAAQRDDAIVKLSYKVAAVAGVTAVPIAAVSAALALPVLAVSAGAMALVHWSRVSVDKAISAERKALHAAGKDSYLSLHLDRVEEFLSKRGGGGSEREAAAARAEWQRLAGAIDVGWAMEHRAEITEAAQLEHELGQLERSSGSDALRSVLGANVAHRLVQQIGQARRAGDSGESFPLVLDEPFAAIDRKVKPALLELILRSAGTPQVVLLTEDADVMAWARLETMTGAASIIEAGVSATQPAAVARS
jgi:hypothetical protein